MDTKKDQLRQLREYTHQRAGMSVCLNALRQAGGNMAKAKDWLRDNEFAEKENDRIRKEAKAIFMHSPPEGTPFKWAYMVAKAEIYLKTGPEIYRRQDAFGMPDPEWDEEILEAIDTCFRQMVQCIGFSKERPFEDVGVEGFYAAMDTLHFQVVSQCAMVMEDGEAMMDVMGVKHRLDGGEITLYNRVPFLEDPFLASL